MELIVPCVVLSGKSDYLQDTVGFTSHKWFYFFYNSLHAFGPIPLYFLALDINVID